MRLRITQPRIQTEGEASGLTLPHVRVTQRYYTNGKHSKSITWWANARGGFNVELFTQPRDDKGAMPKNWTTPVLAASDHA